MIVVADYDCGNVGSVINMVRKVGGDAVLSSDAHIVSSATKLILPGVGAFDQGMKQLRAKSLLGALLERAEAGVPILGICLGMQLLGFGSDEGDLPGLGLINARFCRFSFPENRSLPVPHVGWNTVKVEKDNPLLPLTIEAEEERFYFVHSYHAVCQEAGAVVATADYGIRFPCAYSKNNIFGVQFHPEKSHRFGMALMKRFVDL